MVQGSLIIGTKLERAKLIRRLKKPNTEMPSAQNTQMQLLLTNKIEALATSVNLDSHCNDLTSAIIDEVLETAGGDKPPKDGKISIGTKQLRKKTRQSKRDGTDIQNIKYAKICEAIRLKKKKAA